jgi:predicted small lipoprotein YifL
VGGRQIVSLVVGLVLVAGVTGCQGRRGAPSELPADAEQAASIEAALRSADAVLASVDAALASDP